MLLLSYECLSLHLQQSCCAKWPQCQRMYLFLLYLLVWVFSLTVKLQFCVTVKVMSHLGLSLPQDGLIAFLFRPWVTFIFISYFTPVLELVWSLKKQFRESCTFFYCTFIMGHLRVSCPQRSHLCKCFHKGNNPWVHQATEGKGKRAWLEDIKSVFP